MDSLSTRIHTRLARWRDDFGGDRMLVITGLLVALFVVIAARDITKPFYGINSYAAAHAGKRGQEKGSKRGQVSGCVGRAETGPTERGGMAHGGRGCA